MAKPTKPKAPAPVAQTPQAPVLSAEEVAERRAALRVTKLRERLTKAMNDPELRDQMVKTIRGMIEEKL